MTAGLPAPQQWEEGRRKVAAQSDGLLRRQQVGYDHIPTSGVNRESALVVPLVRSRMKLEKAKARSVAQEDCTTILPAGSGTLVF